MFLLLIKIQMLSTAPPGGHHASPATPTNLLCMKLQLGKQLFNLFLKIFFPQDLLSDLPPSRFGFFLFFFTFQETERAGRCGSMPVLLDNMPVACHKPPDWCVKRKHRQDGNNCSHVGLILKGTSLLGLKMLPFLRVLREQFPSKCSIDLQHFTGGRSFPLFGWIVFFKGSALHLNPVFVSRPPRSPIFGRQRRNKSRLCPLNPTPPCAPSPAQACDSRHFSLCSQRQLREQYLFSLFFFFLISLHHDVAE